MPALQLERLSVRRGDFALDDVTLSVSAGQRLAILGPNGAGKSTLLEAIAGLIPVFSGQIALDGVDCSQLPPEHRQVGYLVQDYGLFPHLTVRENVRFGMRRPRNPGTVEDELLARLRLSGLAERRPATLSGGERQRVALARALAADAKVLLFDEPFSAFDPMLRSELHAELGECLAQLDVPVVFVTQDRSEARVLADRVAIMRAGKVLQHGCVADVFSTPAHPFVARFLGVENLWEGTVTATRDGVTSVSLGAGPMVLAARTARALSPGSRVLACVRAEDVEVTANCALDVAANGINAYAVARARLRANDPFVLVELEAEVPIFARVSKATWASVTSAAALKADIAPEVVHLIPL